MKDPMFRIVPFVTKALVLTTAIHALPTLAERRVSALPFKDARLKFEVNTTDGDAGIQAFIDVDTWKSVEIRDPRGKVIFETEVSGRMAKQGGTEIFLESAEPDFSELPLEQFLKRFPEGIYRFSGRGLNGEKLVGAYELTHTIPDGPVLVSPLSDSPPQSLENTVVRWMTVANPVGSKIVGYQVIVGQKNPTTAAIPKARIEVILPPSATSLAIAPGFLLPDHEYEWEVLAIEESGNQTLSASSFQTEVR